MLAVRMTIEVEIYTKVTKNKVEFNNIFLDPEVCAQYFRLTLELISYLATTYPADAKKNPTKFK